MVVVSNSSPLIWLSRIRALNLLREVCAEVIIPQEVFEEVVQRGKHLGYADAIVVEQAVEAGWIKVKKIKTKLKIQELIEIHSGEAAVLQLALQEKINKVIIDDGAARIIAKGLGLEPRGSVHIIITAAKRNLITAKRARELLTSLVSAGFRLSPEVFAHAIKSLDEMP